MLSIIVPIYKVEDYLKECVDSLISQTYKNIEIILVDDGSPDRSGDICDQYIKEDLRIRVVHQDNQGISAARNTGLSIAKGDYVGFIDPDDWIDLTMFEKLMCDIDKTNSDIAACGYIFERKEKEVKQFDTIQYAGEESLLALADGKIDNHVWNKVFKRELFSEIEFPEGRTYEDFFIMHELLGKATYVCTISDVLYHYRIREGSVTQSDTARHLIDYTDANMARYQFYKCNYPELFELCGDKLLTATVDVMSKLWRHWYGFSKESKSKYADRIEELKQFNRKEYPLFGNSNWPKYLRFSSVFMHSTNSVSFAVLYWITRLTKRVVGR